MRHTLWVLVHVVLIVARGHHASISQLLPGQARHSQIVVAVSRLEVQWIYSCMQCVYIYTELCTCRTVLYIESTGYWEWQSYGRQLCTGVEWTKKVIPSVHM